MKFEVTLELDGEISTASVNSLRLQLETVIDEALADNQIEIPDAEIFDYEVAILQGDGFLD